MFIDFRERESERERKINQLSSACTLTGDWTPSLGMCHDRELNLQPFEAQDEAPTNRATWPGLNKSYFKKRSVGSYTLKLTQKLVPMTYFGWNEIAGDRLLQNRIVNLKEGSKWRFLMNEGLAVCFRKIKLTLKYCLELKYFLLKVCFREKKFCSLVCGCISSHLLHS